MITNEDFNQKMMAISCLWNKKPSFKLIPLSINCPYNEVIYDPEAEVLVIISKDKKERPHMLPKIDDKGRNIYYKQGSGDAIPSQTRIMMDTYYEYYIEDLKDISYFLNMFVYNQNSKVTELIMKGASLPEETKSKKTKEKSE